MLDAKKISIKYMRSINKRIACKLSKICFQNMRVYCHFQQLVSFIPIFILVVILIDKKTHGQHSYRILQQIVYFLERYFEVFNYPMKYL